ncbi:P-type HAD superfamily ATPase, Ca2+-transporting ATPase [Gulosibacter molinativorax]|nr:P-type HAD superfamily ATPase, Ca2+-transporting ATPase [Gulosibacter molinativorax]
MDAQQQIASQQGNSGRHHRGHDSASEGAASERWTETAYLLSADEVLERLESSATGLSAEEAQRRAQEFGPNAIISLERDNAFLRYLNQFKDWLIILLLACAAVTAYLGDWNTSIVLLVLVGINTVIGFTQEQRARHTMKSLEDLVKPSAEVLRDGKLLEIESASIVPGDVVRLAEGDFVPADVRIIEAQALSTNEFALTGESEPSRKHTHAIKHEVPLGDRFNLAFAGTTVAQGEGLGVAIDTGMRMELGRIASLSESAVPTPSPLQRETTRIAQVVGTLVVGLTAIVLALGVWANMPFREALLFAVGMACALVPQGLPAEVNTALAQASSTLARKNALVKRLTSVETLGATAVICTDKTGTLTKNEMTVEELLIGLTPATVTGTGYAPEGELVDDEGRTLAPEATPRILLECGVLASNAKLLPPDAEHADWWILGDPTEGALLTLAAKGGIDLDALQREQQEIRELPFDSVRQRMTSIRLDARGKYRAWVKGNPERVLERAVSILDGEAVRPLTDEDRAHILGIVREREQRALRNLALAVRDLDREDARAENEGPMIIEQGLTFLGVASMIDPVRDEVPSAIAATLGAHIRINIITGDSALTASAIARSAGLVDEQNGELRTVTTAQLQQLTDAQVLELALAGGVVFSRVSPEDKLRIVNLIKGSGTVVAVTGDGINDAPALRSASIGVAMGRSGTDVAKQSADLILLDDSFASLVRAIREGRRIYANIAKGVLSCLTTNAAELVVNLVSLALAAVAGVPVALNVLQILAIDLLGEILPIAALGSDPEEGETMRRAPRDRRARILNRRTLLDVGLSGTVMGVLALAGYLLTYRMHGVDPAGLAATDTSAQLASTVTYVTILVTQFVNIIHRRSVHGAFSRIQLRNRWFWLAVLVATVLMLAIVYVPFIGEFFGTAPLGLEEWGLVLIAAAVMLAARYVIAWLPAVRGEREAA